MTQSELGILISKCFAVYAGLKALWHLPALSSVFAFDMHREFVSAHIASLVFTGGYILLLIGVTFVFWCLPHLLGNRILPEKTRNKKITPLSFEQSVVLLFIAAGCLIFINMLSQLASVLKYILIKPVDIPYRDIFRDPHLQEQFLQVLLHTFLAGAFILGAEGLKNIVLKLRGRGRKS